MAEYPDAIAFAPFAGGGHDPLMAGFAAGTNDRPASGKVACAKTWGVEEIKLSCSGKTSKSFSDRGHGPVAAGKAADGRFWFAPKKDQVTVTWKLRKPENAERVKLELYRAGSSSPIWMRTLDTDPTKAEHFDAPWDGSFPAGEWVAAADFPDHVPTVEHSPYMLKIHADGGNVEDGYVERWTYFDVLVEKIELTWGGAALIPAGARADVTALFRAQTAADEAAIVADLATKTTGAGLVDPAVRYEVKLPSNQFSQDAADMRSDWLYLRHLDQWGKGPRIPLVAKIWILRAGGAGVHDAEAAVALGKARFLWDWESEDEIAGIAAAHPTVAVQTFLTASLDYKRNDPKGPRGSTNCHAEHGGKRGGDVLVFPESDATVFPFQVDRCATRQWASTSLPHRTGPHACKTGVLLQPSRMAKDTYKVTVYLASEKAPGGAPALDTVALASAIAPAHAALPSASTGFFEVLRQMDCTYVRKAPAVQAANLAMSDTEYRRAGVVLAWLAGAAAAAEELRFQTGFDALVTRILDPAGTLKDPDTGAPAVGVRAPTRTHVRRLSDAFAGINQLNGGTAAAVEWGLTAREYDDFMNVHRVPVMRDYVTTKARKINTPKKHYDRWRVANPLPADDSAYLLGVYAALSAAKRRKVDAILQQRLIAVQIPTNRDQYNTSANGAAQQIMKMVGQQFAYDAARDGLTCIHAVDGIRYRRNNGTFVESPTTVGGFAPSDANARDSRRTLNIMFIPTTPIPARLLMPDVYKDPASPIIKHEIGHNFYLCHAPAAPDAARDAPGHDLNYHDVVDLRCLMNYDIRSDHLCGFCNLRLRGWALRAGSGGGVVTLSNTAATNRVP